MRAVVSAVVSGAQHSRLIEEALDALCTTLGATSAWSTFESKETAPVHRPRTSSFHAVPPAVLAEHVTKVLSQVESRRRTIAGPVPYAETGSFAAVPLWAPAASPRANPRLVAAIYLDFPEDQGTQSSVVEFLESVAALLGTMTAQQALVESFQENLREQQARHDPSQYLDLDELLAPRSMRAIRDEVRAAIRSNASILILGESGTGKTQLATAIARASKRTPIVRATLGFSDDLNTITSELFGHERGAFSGAVTRRKGLVEYANKGTLILDEVLNLSPHAQQLLLDLTQFGTYRPLGYQGLDPKKAELRLISVTNGDIGRAIADTRFRQDLFFRLATVPLTLPPLRERRTDIPDIAGRYLKRTDPRKHWVFDEDAVALLSAPHLEWAGNIRELESVLERAKNRATATNDDSELIEGRHLDLPPKATPIKVASEPPAAASVRQSSKPPAHAVGERWVLLAKQRAELDDVERGIIRDALLKSGGVVAQTARALSVSRTSLISRMATLNINLNEESSERAT
jgi:transcriptional regulator with GAF, ATPase, and Fis domain